MTLEGGGLAPCEATRPPRGVRRHAPPENFGLYIQFAAILEQN